MMRSDFGRGGWTIVAAFYVLLLTSAYLAASATPSLFYFVNVALHVVVGLGLAVACAWQLRNAPLGIRGIFAAVPLGLAASLGIALAVVGATRAHAALLRAHIVSAVIGSAIALWWLGTLVRRTGR